jgi:hypothetical protein
VQGAFEQAARGDAKLADLERRLAAGPPDSLAAERAVKRRRQELLLAVLADLRPMGHVRHASAQPVLSAHQVPRSVAAQAGPALLDWRERLTGAERFYPDEWLHASSRRPLLVASTARGFYDGGAEVLAMEDTSIPAYDGAMDDSAQSTVVHELGHRMEQYVPGIRELEFAFSRHRSTPGGQVEQPVQLAVLTGLPYDRDEVAYPDAWDNPGRLCAAEFSQPGQNVRVTGFEGVDPVDPAPGNPPLEVGGVRAPRMVRPQLPQELLEQEREVPVGVVVAVVDDPSLDRRPRRVG